MAFLDKLNDIAKNIGDKTTDAIEVTKLNAKVSSEKNAASEDLKKIGEFYYSVFTSGGQVAPMVLEFCQSGKAHFTAADAAQSEIDRIHAESAPAPQPQPQYAPTGISCPSCGSVNTPGTKFCCQCGGALAAPAAPSVCPSCGEPASAGLKFCGKCGAKLF